MSATSSAMLRHAMTATRNRRRLLQSWAILLGSDGLDDFYTQTIQRRIQEENPGSPEPDTIDGFNAIYLPILSRATREVNRIIPATEEDPDNVKPILILISLAEPGSAEEAARWIPRNDRSGIVRIATMLASGSRLDDIQRRLHHSG